MKYQIGQQVRVNTNNFKGDPHFSLYSGMADMDGTITTIAGARETPYSDRYEIEGSLRVWHEDCLEEAFICNYCGFGKREDEVMKRNGLYICGDCIEELAVCSERRGDIE